MTGVSPALAHHGLEPLMAERRVAVLAEVGEIAHQHHAQPVGPIVQQRVVDLDVDAEEVEAESRTLTAYLFPSLW